jgi:hypothetical protein
MWAPNIEPLLIVGDQMWLASPGPSGVGQGLRDRSHRIYVASMADLTVAGAEIKVAPTLIDWPAPVDQPTEKDATPASIIIQCWSQTQGEAGAVVWIGTRFHGLARFEKKDGQWAGRWYTSRAKITVIVSSTAASVRQRWRPR